MRDLSGDGLAVRRNPRVAVHHGVYSAPKSNPFKDPILAKLALWCRLFVASRKWPTTASLVADKLKLVSEKT
jgi:hypothetical protein